MNMYMHRMAMSVTIVKMVNHTALHQLHLLDIPQPEVPLEEGGAVLYFLWKNDSQFDDVNNDVDNVQYYDNESNETITDADSCLAAIQKPQISEV